MKYYRKSRRQCGNFLVLSHTFADENAGTLLLLEQPKDHMADLTQTSGYLFVVLHAALVHFCLLRHKGRITLAVRGAVGVDVAIHFSTNPRELVPRGVARFWFQGLRSRHDRQPTRQQTISIPPENKRTSIFKWDRHRLLASRLAIVAAAATSMKPESCNTARNRLTRIG